MNVYGISFSTTNYGSGVAIVIASNTNEAFQCLKASGKLNGIPNEYKLIEAVVVSSSCIEQTTLVYENYSGEVHIIPETPDYKELTKITQYLYEIIYDNIDYEFTEEYFKTHEDTDTPFGCTSIRSGNIFGRNLDWYYNNNVTFVVKVPRKNNRFASIGVAGSIPNLTDAFVSSRAKSDSYKLLPFYTLDGLNEYGVFCNTNVVPLEENKTTKTIPDIETKRTLCSRMLPRFILDNFTSALDAVNYIKNYVSVYIPKSIQNSGYEVHIMVGDSTSTYIIEFIENRVVITEKSQMTNFIINGVTFNQDGTVYTQETSDTTHNPVDTNNISPKGVGLERYNKIVSLSSISGVSEMRQALNSLFYTNTYKDSTSPFWYSEYVSEDLGINLLTPINNPTLQAFIAGAKDAYIHRNRNNPVTWHTVHSSIYDINSKKLYLKSQEEDREYIFNLITI